ncbi:YebC/PmpR family DNA-binding transcriptional regulator [Verrucomicrobia bacterium]|nr:YebC/PmpR family DNA-binding transcriptional regulator [Verrucomicrobiota bacterium]MDC0219784.1 YebC/PmpR family DNA-binding transcriptional regulator [Verrucomicrobiota bacterium]
MAGHSKWANIKHTKARMDAKRSKVFAKIAREITIAAKLNGGDPDMNPRLRLAVLKGRGANMPADNIQRAIARGTGDGEGASFEELTYEIYGPHGAAILCEVSTDNRNRTASEIRAILTRNEGKLATAGSVRRLFHRKGQIMIARANAEEDALMELAMEAGAEDFKAEEEGYEILTAPADFEAVHKAVETDDIATESAELTALPELTVPLASESELVKVNRLVDLLDDHDDVQEVYSNAEFDG